MAKKILIVDDEEIIVKMYHDRLVADGFVVETATDGEAGLFLALKNHPDVMILDLMMPKMDGLTVMKKLRSDEWGKNALIILLTNRDPNDSMLSDVTKEAPAYYLLKSSLNANDLSERVKSLVGTAV